MLGQLMFPVGRDKPRPSTASREHKAAEQLPHLEDAMLQNLNN